MQVWRRLCVMALVLAAVPAVAQKTVTIGGDDNYSQQTLTVGDTLVIKLPEARGDGLEWRLKPTEDTAVTLQPPARNARPSNTQTLTFLATNPGVQRVTLNNVKRADKAQANPVQVYEVMVGVSSRAGEEKQGVEVAKFERFMPCADCEGVHETLTFYAKAPKELVDTTYMDTLEYIGKPKDTTFTDKGTWVMTAGTKADPSAPVYQTTSSKGSVTKYWIRAVNQIVPLDNLGVPMEGPAGKPLMTPEAAKAE